ncbi:minor tail protein [Microbacterium phage NoodlelyBoi]|uniref:Minor tail protein n=1 Tax=Microbacterium phage NoodlelyBoi TaxID=2813165 RepID=A0A899IQW2_9CAUD|nr:minor tail protein [Microbacterium phage NoodlelyBoi]QSM01232.1 minor tail protein [Microbacterium phage NoodlelyBoi]
MTIYEGYLSFGGNEIVNNARTYGISHSARPCPMHWLKGDVCGTQNAALFESAPYTYDAIETAPWYDPDMPQSADFYGFFAYSITEAMDSTRIVSRTERVGNGTVNGRTRKSGKTMRVKGLLMGRGRLAIEYGQAWLSAAVDPGACGQHGTECGLTDLQWFADCPPDRGQVDDMSEWAETRRNVMINPRPPVYAGSGWTLSHTGSITPDGVTATLTATATGYVWSAPTATPMVAGRVYAIRAKVKASAVAGSAAATVHVRPHKRTGNIYYPTPDAGGNILVPTDGVQREVAFYFRATADAPASEGFELSVVSVGTMLAGSTVSVNDVLIEEVGTDIPSTPPGPFFFGGTPAVTEPDGTERRYTWAGPEYQNASVEESRYPVLRPQTDAEYQATVDGYVRYMHDVSAISGPLILNTLQAGDFYAYEVEMVFGAERPWVFGKSRDIELPPTTPLVIQDIPYNLFPAPSAELAAGTVVTARNLSPNPSVETNATGWTTVADGSAILGANVAGARSTALASVGAASYRALFTAPSAAFDQTAAWFGAQQEVPITDPLERHSINIWAALVPLAGASVPAGIDIQAYWRSAANVTLRTDPLGVIPTEGGFISVSSILPPPGAASVIVRSRGLLTSWASGATVQLFTDALAVTVP